MEKIYKNFFQFAKSQTNFPFNGNMYNQVDGVTMGSALAPNLANIFMGFHEKGWLEITIIKGMLMIYLQFLKLKIILLHFTVILISNTVI